MSTNAVAHVYDEWGNETPISSIYKHWDGYPDGFGDQLREIAAKYSIGNGIPGGGAPENFANGMGCFAAFLVKELKEQPGDVYLCPADQREEYNYHIRCSQLGGAYDRVKVTCDEDPDWSAADA